MSDAAPNPAVTPPELPETMPRQVRTRGRGRYSTKSRANNTRNAARWVLAIGIIQIVFGIFLGFNNRSVAAKAREHLSPFADDEVLQLENGKTETAGALRLAIDREEVQLFVVLIGLGVMFLAIYFWARKSPLPALGTALALYVTVHAVDAVADPNNIYRGMVLKVLCILALVRGVKSALQQRALNQQDEAAQA